MFDYIPQIIVGLIVLAIGLLFCRIIISIWRWVGLSFFFKPPIEASNMPAVIWLKTVPLLVYFSVMPIPLIAALGIWDFDPISMPVSHYLNTILASPPLFIGILTVVAATHIFLMKSANKNLSN